MNKEFNTQAERVFYFEKWYWWHKGLQGLVKRYIEKSEDKIGIDAGCGSGIFLTILNNCRRCPDIRIFGLDRDIYTLKLALKRNLAGKILQADMNFNLPVKENSVDFFLSVNVLYSKYIKEEIYVLNQMHQKLKPGGKIYLILPAFEFLRSGHDIIANTRKRYTKNEVLLLLEKSNFKIKKITYYNFFLFPLLVLKRILSKNKKPETDIQDINLFLNYILTKILIFENFLIEKMNLPIGGSIFAIAEK